MTNDGSPGRKAFSGGIKSGMHRVVKRRHLAKQKEPIPRLFRRIEDD